MGTTRTNKQNATNNVASVNANAANAANAANSVSTNEPLIIKGKVMQLLELQENKKRISIQLDCEGFETINVTTGEIKMTNTFGMDTYILGNQLKKFVKSISIAHRLAMGKRINKKLFALMLVDADITAKRIFHKQGEERKYYNNENEQFYTNDGYETEIVSCVPHVDKMIEDIAINTAITSPIDDDFYNSNQKMNIPINPLGI